MTTTTLVLDDRTGNFIPPNTDYYQVELRGAAWKSVDVQTPGQVLAVLSGAMRAGGFSSYEVRKCTTGPGEVPKPEPVNTVAAAPDDSPFGPIRKFKLSRTDFFVAGRDPDALAAIKARAEKRRAKYIAALAELCGCNDPDAHEGGVFKP